MKMLQGSVKIEVYIDVYFKKNITVNCPYNHLKY